MVFGKAVSPRADEPVTALELFFDLVFVFIVTQVTALIVDSGGYLQAAGVLVVTWWIYDGYAWLGNNVAPTTPSTILPMLVAMTGFLVMAAAVPDAFGSGAWAFALAYLLVVIVHGFSFARSSQEFSLRAFGRALSISLTVSALLITAAVLGGRWGWICWLVAGVGLLGYTLFARAGSFTLRAGHFAERHRLLLIIALGEIVIAVGAGARGHLGDLTVLLAIVLAMVLISAMWWVYFVGDHHEQGERVLDETAPELVAERGRWAYSVAHLVLIGGLVLTAAGMHEVVHGPTHHLSLTVAATMAGGTAMFLLGVVLFLRRLSLGSGVDLLVAAAVSLVMTVLGTLVNGLAQLVGLALVLVGLAVRQRA